jgi:hypothetical protein
MPNVANTKIGVPKPPKTTERLAQADVNIALIMPPNNECN